MFRGLEQRREVTASREERIRLDGQQRSRGPRASAGGPRRLELHQHPFALETGAGIVGHIDVHHLAIAIEVEIAVIEIPGDRDEVALEAGSAVTVGGNRHVGRLALIDRFGRRERRAAGPPLGNPGIARLGHRAGPEIGAHVDMVPVNPAYPGLGRG